MAVEPETNAQKQARDGEEPGRGRSLGIDDARSVGLIGSDPRSDCVGNIIASVRDRHHHGADHLAVGPHMLDSNVVALGASVDLSKCIGVVSHDISHHALQQGEFEVSPPFLRVGPGEVFDGDDPKCSRISTSSC